MGFVFAFHLIQNGGDLFHKIVDDFFFVAILEDAEEIHELEDGVITYIPVIAGEEGVQFLVYLVGYDVEARLVILAFVHQGDQRWALS